MYTTLRELIVISLYEDGNGPLRLGEIRVLVKSSSQHIAHKLSMLIRDEEVNYQQSSPLFRVYWLTEKGVYHAQELLRGNGVD